MKEVKIKNNIIKISDDYDPSKDPEPYMKKEHLAYFKLKMLKEIEKANEIDSSKFINIEVGDFVDNLIRDKEAVTDAETKKRANFYIQRLNIAIKKIDEDRYGYCLETGDKIGLERLKSRPTTDFCFEVQERKDNEKIQKESESLIQDGE